MELNELRNGIDAVDEKIIELVQERMDIAARIADYKREHALPVLDAGRERSKLENIASRCRPDMEEYVVRLYKEMFAVSRAYQQSLLERSDG